ncbi:hypothetical protein TNIN_354401 [Trichonephila inaurata madagascariensis]|uniref:Uncharacterized protein n=1 Tax=Trichonephila inaurata madagascariensis TaxID=2747483 RepID=A0A8X6YPQ1_9ARAC|nr:hypothetical protein TNIN_354401 [Trichonephila inaurata madagascariensis]
MAINELKAKRKGLRQAFTLRKIENELNKENADRKVLSVLRTQIADKFQRIDNCQLLLSEELLKEENGELLFSEDFEEAKTEFTSLAPILQAINSKRGILRGLRGATLDFGLASTIFTLESIIDRTKSRVAPLKPLSIPRLELIACSIGAKLIVNMIQSELLATSKL